MKKNFKVYHLGTHKNFDLEDLVWCILSKNTHFISTDRIEHADIVIRGVYSTSGIASTRSGRIVRRAKSMWRKGGASTCSGQPLSLRDNLDPHRNQIWLHLSGEKPNNTASSSFLNSECDIGIGHEPILSPSYFRMPHWYQSIDWAHEGFPRSLAAFYRLGEPIQVHELKSGLSASSLSKRNGRCALVSSHLTSPRDILVNELQRVMPVDVYGTAGAGPSQFKSQRIKRDLLRDYSLVLAPENALYPGYVTEKIPEAYASGVFAVGWYLAGIVDDFASGSHLNAADYGAQGISIGGQLAEVVQRELRRSQNEGVPPLINKSPTVEPLVDFLDKALVGNVKG